MTERLVQFIYLCSYDFVRDESFSFGACVRFTLGWDRFLIPFDNPWDY